jgi:hypothetical protein
MGPLYDRLRRRQGGTGAAGLAGSRRAAYHTPVIPADARSDPSGDQIARLVTLVMAGVALSSLVSLPQRTVQLHVLGTPLGVSLTSSVLPLLLAVLTAAGMDALVRSVPGRARAGIRYTSTFWILPVLVALAAAVAVPAQSGNPRGWLATLLLLGGLLLAVVVAEHGTVRLDAPGYRSARLLLNLATYLAAFALYAVIYGLEVRSLLSATAVGIVTFPLALELLRGTEEQLETTWLYAAIIAAVLGELTWALNALGLRALAGGALLFVVFYAFGGVAQQHLAGRLNRRVAAEFAVVSLVGLLAIWLTAG